MRTMINGTDADWTPEIQAKWETAMAGVEDPRPVSLSNYFQPRPYVDEYNRGSHAEGFTYTRGQTVYQTVIART